MLSEGYVDIIQPDPSHAGGITETRKIAAMAEARGAGAALPGPIALATCLQIDAGCYNALIQEQSLGIHYNAANDLLDYVSNREAFAYQDGMVSDPAGRAWASRSTRNTSNAPPSATAGATPSARHGSFAEW